MADFTVPQGDPDALRAVARHVQSSSHTVGSTRRSSVHRHGTVAQDALPRLRATDFKGALGETTKALDAVAMSMGTVSGALSTYAGALEQAQHKIKAAKTAYDTAEREWKNANDDKVAQQHHREMIRQEGKAGDAHDDLRTTRRMVKTALSGELHVWVPKGATSPSQAWVGAANGLLPKDLHLDRKSLEDAYKHLRTPKEAVANAIKLGTKGWQGGKLLQWLRAGSISRKAEEEYAKAITAYQELKGSSPDLSDPKTYKKYLKLERKALKAYKARWPADAIRAQKEYRFLRGLVGDKTAMSRLRQLYPGLSDAEIVGKTGKFARLLAPLRAASPWVSRVMAPVAIVSGGLDVFSAITDKDMPTDDRWARGIGGVGSIAAGGATILVMAGLVSNPVGWGIIVGGSALAIGDWAYEHRKQIWNGIKWTGGKLADGAKAVGHFASDVGSGAKHVVSSVWHGLGL